MEQIIRNMIDQAVTKEDYSLIEYARQLIYKCAITINCPGNWRNIGEKLAEEFDFDSWEYENLELCNYR